MAKAAAASTSSAAGSSSASSTAAATNPAATTGVDNTANAVPTFSTDEILWYNNGKWGAAGYAIPNPAGKTATMNLVIKQFCDSVGRCFFDLAHRLEARFAAPPQSQYWFDLNTCLNLARSRLANQTRNFNDPNGLDVTHAAPDYEAFLVWPVPYFGQRIRQSDLRMYIKLGLLMLQEAMQHSDNERPGYISNDFAWRIGKYIQEILAQMAMKYFGYTRAQAYAATFALAATDFSGYNPAQYLMSTELTEDRPPLYWWPTSNDLDAISGIPIQDALTLAQQWPATPRMYVGAQDVGISTAGGSPASPIAGGGSTPAASQAVNTPSSVAAFAQSPSAVPSAATAAAAAPAAAATTTPAAPAPAAT
jgi:hypothetical protein